MCLCYLQILKFAHLESDEDRIRVGKEVYDMYIMRELLSQTHVSQLSQLLLTYLLIYLITLLFNHFNENCSNVDTCYIVANMVYFVSLFPLIYIDFIFDIVFTRLITEFMHA